MPREWWWNDVAVSWSIHVKIEIWPYPTICCNLSPCLLTLKFLLCFKLWANNSVVSFMPLLLLKLLLMCAGFHWTATCLVLYAETVKSTLCNVTHPIFTSSVHMRTASVVQIQVYVWWASYRFWDILAWWPVSASPWPFYQRNFLATLIKPNWSPSAG